jgi:ketosteroid isomerase-like protein
MRCETVVLAFVEAINTKQMDKLSALMSEDHRFIDSDGSETLGREQMSDAWRHYFEMVPDYRIEVREVLSRGDVVALLGVAEGTFAGPRGLDPKGRWSVPAAWRVVIENERVAVWQLYVNPEPMRAALDRTGHA